MILPLDTLRTIADSQPHPLLFATISGAHLYGFPSADSDYDLRGVHILPLTDVAGLYPLKETIDDLREVAGLELDLVTYDVKKFFESLLKRDGKVLEQVMSPLVVRTSPHFDELRAILPACATQSHAFHYLGFSKRKWDEFLKETPHRIKPLLYVYRGLLTGIHLMRTGEVEANLVTLNKTFKLTYIPELVERKMSGVEHETLGEADLEFHKGEFERLTKLLETERESTRLPENSEAKPALHDLLLRIRGVGEMNN